MYVSLSLPYAMIRFSTEIWSEIIMIRNHNLFSYTCQHQVRNSIEKRLKVRGALWTEVHPPPGPSGWTPAAPQDSYQPPKRSLEGENNFFLYNLDHIVLSSYVYLILVISTTYNVCKCIIFPFISKFDSFTKMFI